MDKEKLTLGGSISCMAQSYGTEDEYDYCDPSSPDYNESDCEAATCDIYSANYNVDECTAQMCDPTSINYDEAACASYSGWDPTDPCDSSSPYYDEIACAMYSGWDPNDPCDTSSPYYNEAACNGSSGGGGSGGGGSGGGGSGEPPYYGNGKTIIDWVGENQYWYGNGTYTTPQTTYVNSSQNTNGSITHSITVHNSFFSTSTWDSFMARMNYSDFSLSYQFDTNGDPILTFNVNSMDDVNFIDNQFDGFTQSGYIQVNILQNPIDPIPIGLMKPDPCGWDTKQFGISATSFLKPPNNQISATLDVLRSRWGLKGNEEGFAIGGSNGPTTIPYGLRTWAGSPTGVSLLYNHVYTNSTVHTHLTGNPPSAQDMFNLATESGESPYKVKGQYIVGETEATDYYLGVLKPDLLARFKACYPESVYVADISHGFKSGTIIADKYDEALAAFKLQDSNCSSLNQVISDKAIAIARGKALAYVLDKFDTGLILYKRDSNGVFKSITSSKDNSSSAYSSSICN
jgi:hypothetical protein